MPTKKTFCNKVRQIFYRPHTSSESKDFSIKNIEKDALKELESMFKYKKAADK